MGFRVIFRVKIGTLSYISNIEMITYIYEGRFHQFGSISGHFLSIHHEDTEGNNFVPSFKRLPTPENLMKNGDKNS